MGYMTTVTILNDGFSEIKNNPKEFVANIEKGMNGNLLENKQIDYYGIGNHCNPMLVAKSHHADMPKMYLTYQNMMIELGYSNDVKNLELRKKLLTIAENIINNEKESIKECERKLK